MQKMRQHQRYLTKLQKISQTSSPSKQQQSPHDSTSLKSRVNPASLASSYLKFKRFQQQKQKKFQHQEESARPGCITNEMHQNQSKNKNQSIEQKNQRISNLQELIIRRKMQLTTLEECFQKRTHSSSKINYEEIFASLFKNILKTCSKSKQGRKSYLTMVLKYGKERKTHPENSFKILVEWTLKIVRQFFSLLSYLLKIPFSNTQ